MDAKTPKHYLPHLAILTGTTLSFIFWYILQKNLRVYLDTLVAIQAYLPWLALFFGLGISILIAAIIRMTLLAAQRAHYLHESNESLRREIKNKLSLEESKQKLEVALLQGQKLQAMGTLAGGIAHDFNNILYAIIGYTELTMQDVEKNSVAYNNLGKMLEATHRGQELIARILAFSRRQHHTHDPLKLKKAIETALSLLRPTIPASVHLEYDLKSDSSILGNQTQIHQVLVNLINNAVDAMDGDGTITIRTQDIDSNNSLLHEFPVKPDTAYCEIEITDTGHGMDQHTAERIFEPFFTTKEVGKGTGLGLSIVHSIIEEHQGHVTATSQLGQGTRFVIILPVYKEGNHGNDTTS